jgi:hypothetical protein
MHGGMILQGENEENRREIFSSATLSATAPTLTDPGARTLDLSVSYRRLIAWAMAWSCNELTTKRAPALKFECGPELKNTHCVF